MLLGRYRMSVCEAMERYRHMCEIVVEKVRESSPRKDGASPPTFSKNRKVATGLNTRDLKLVSALPSPDEDDRHLRSDAQRCQTIICGSGPELKTLRSYDRGDPPERFINALVLECVGVSPPPGTHCELKYYYNSPSHDVLGEINHLLSADDDEDIDLLSIGAAIHDPVDPKADALQAAMSWHIKLTHNSLVHTQQRDHSKLHRYHRLDVPDDHRLRGIGVNKWTPGTAADPLTFGRIERATTAYLSTADTAAQLQALALSLVERRRLRATTARWEPWARGLTYRCPEPGCRDSTERFVDRGGFREHVHELHGGEVRQVEHAGYYCYDGVLVGAQGCGECDEAMTGEKGDCAGNNGILEEGRAKGEDLDEKGGGIKAARRKKKGGWDLMDLAMKAAGGLVR